MLDVAGHGRAGLLLVLEDSDEGLLRHRRHRSRRLGLSCPWLSLQVIAALFTGVLWVTVPARRRQSTSSAAVVLGGGRHHQAAHRPRRHLDPRPRPAAVAVRLSWSSGRSGMKSSLVFRSPVRRPTVDSAGGRCRGQCQGRWRQTPLRWAAKFCLAEAVQVLLAAGAEVNACESRGPLVLDMVRHDRSSSPRSPSGSWPLSPPR